jgi:hypothetical protein
VLGIHVVGDRFSPARRSRLERVVELSRHEAGVAELAHVAGEEGGHELALPEDAAQAPSLVDDGQRRQAAIEEPLDGPLNRVVPVKCG